METIVLRAIQRYLKKHFPKERRKIVRRAGAILPKLKAKAPDLGGKENSLANNLDMFLLFLSYYEATDHRMDGAAVDEIIEDLYDHLKFLGGLMNINRKGFLSLLRKSLYKSYGKYAAKVAEKQAKGEWLETWGMIVNPKDTKVGFAFTLVGCPIANYAKKYGYEELMPHMCALDHAYAKLMHAKLIRTHTVATGADSCDYWYVPDRSKTARNYKGKMKRSFKYAFLLKACKLAKLQRVMELPPQKAQKLFRKAYKGVVIPKMTDEEIEVTTEKVKGSICLWYRHKKTCDRVCIYLVGGGMLKYPKPSQAKEVLSLAKKTGVDFVLPYYPLVLTGHTLPDVYEMIYALYKKILKKYSAEKVSILGGSSGANLALGLISFINEKGEGLSMPGKIYAGSPGSLLVTEEEKRKAALLDKTDVIMSRKATLSVWEGMTGGKKVADYMESLQLGNYTGLKDVYLTFGGDEVFAACAHSIKARLEQFGVHVTMEIAPGMYHCYACFPLVKESLPAYERMIVYIKNKND